MEHLLSVIVPTYNSRNTLERLFSSLTKTFLNNENLIEVIFVDDGSSDTTVAELEQLKEKHSNFDISILSNKHAGVSQARNSGIEKSTGKYITFLDSDDELIPCDIDELKKSLLSKVDLIWFNESNSGSYDLLQSKNKLTVLTKMSITGNGSIKDGIHGKFYRRAFIKQNQLLFNPTLRIGEDVIFNFECLCRAANLNLSTMLIYQRNASSSVHLFDKYNVTNELNFRKSILQITDLFKSSPEAQNIKTRFGINGLIFLIECYFAPLVRNGSLSLREASAKLQKIMLDGHYTGFDTNKFDNALSKRGKIFRRLINKKRFGMAIILLNTEDKIKGIKRI